MDFSWPDSVELVRKNVRAVLAEAWPERLRLYAMNEQIARDLHGAETTIDEIDDGTIRGLWRALGRADLFRIGVPEELGGIGGGALERYAVESEVASVGAPLPSTALGVVVPTLVSLGPGPLADRFMPAILAGESEFAIGYTEPEAGTDLAAVRTTAVLDGDEYVVRGQKLYTSGAHYSDHLWAAVRTDPDAPRHRGISLLIIPMDAEGITVTPLHTMSGTRTNIVFLDDVRVRRDNLVGTQDEGWRLITHALAHERYTALLAAPVVKAYQALVDEVGADPDVESQLAQFRARARVTSLLSVRAAVMASTGQSILAEAAMSKVVVTELRHDISRAALDLIGADGLLTEWAADPPAGGQFERMLRHSFITLFTAGANDIQRDLIARSALGLPRSGA